MFQILPNLIFFPNSKSRFTPLCGFIMIHYYIFYSLIFQIEEYLVKWQNFSLYDCTWEPRSHLPRAVLDDFSNPTPSQKEIQRASDILLFAVQGRLNQRCGAHFYVDLEHDLFRYFFGVTEQSKRKLYLNDFSRFSFPDDWDAFYYSVHGEGRRIDFPILISASIRWSKKRYHITTDNTYQMSKQSPRELWKIEICTKRIN